MLFCRIRMTPSRWTEVRDLLARCLEADPRDVPALLDSVCREDPNLRREVESLLAASRQEAFIDKSVHHSPPVAQVLLPGARIAQYSINTRIGEGGMGIVYDGRDNWDGSRVALKAIHGLAAAEDLVRARFLREARVLSSLNHPNIVRIREILTHASQPVIVMEFVEGRPLSDLITAGALPVETAISIAIQVASAIGCAHRAGVIHRDVKPANVMITSGGVVKVLDFGAAKQFVVAEGDDPVSSTATGVLLGSPAYMSPEQTLGKPADASSDVFSFGSLLYEMLTGIKAFERSSIFATLSAVAREHPRDVQSLRPEAPAGLSWLIRQCLNKQPRRRPTATSIEHFLATSAMHGRLRTTIHALCCKLPPFLRKLVYTEQP